MHSQEGRPLNSQHRPRAKLSSPNLEVRSPPRLSQIEKRRADRRAFQPEGAAAKAAAEAARDETLAALNSSSSEEREFFSAFNPRGLPAAAAFKVLPDGAGGRLAFCRVYSGESTSARLPVSFFSCV